MRTLRRVLLRGRLAEARKWATEWLVASGEHVAKTQLAALRERWREATRNVPYYRDLVESGHAPDDFSSLEEYRHTVPILTRETLIVEEQRFRRTAAPDYVCMTAGSTGNPLRFGCWKDEAIHHTAVNQWVGRMANGMRESDRVFLLWGHSHLLGTGRRGRWRNAVRRLSDRSLGYARFDAYHMEPETALRYGEALRRFRPVVVIGYSCSLDLFARHNLNAGRSAADLGVRLCVACSEMFPQPDSRETIGRYLGCPVVMEYGGVDFGVCAYELGERSGYRAFWWSHYLETEGRSADGPLIVTNLTPRYLPMFRYRNGDECEGATHASTGHVDAFSAIRGRINDVLAMPDGRSVHSVALFHCIHQESVWSIQLVVHGEKMRIRLATKDLTPIAEKRIRARLADLHPSLRDCPFEVVPDVATNRAGKRRWIIQETGRPRD